MASHAWFISNVPQARMQLFNFYELCTMEFPFEVKSEHGTCNSCNMGMSDLPDMYARSPRAEGIHIRRITSAHVTTNM